MKFQFFGLMTHVKFEQFSNNGKKCTKNHKTAIFSCLVKYILEIFNIHNGK